MAASRTYLGVSGEHTISIEGVGDEAVQLGDVWKSEIGSL
jgi:hypothetical protein